MTIRTRLTFWYGGVLLVSTLLMIGVLYFELVVEPAWARAAGATADTIPTAIAEIIFVHGVPTALLTLFGGWWLLSKALAPLNNLASAAERLHIHNLHEPLPRTNNGDEVDRLSEVLNATNHRLENSINQVREFTLHASHELKTPLAILHGEIEICLNDPHTTAVQREAYASQLDEIQRLTKIVESLTLLAKADAGLVVLSRDEVALHELVHDSFVDTQMLAQQKKIIVTLDVCDEVIVCGDRHRLRQLLLNLTDNALKYNIPGGKVEIALKRDAKFSELTIANTGEGIPPAILPRVFDRFFRGDASHSAEIEGCGLGLSIAQWIVKAHSGEIEIVSGADKIIRVTMKLPLPPK